MSDMDRVGVNSVGDERRRDHRLFRRGITEID
jgi:hypothetical protein